MDWTLHVWTVTKVAGHWLYILYSKVSNGSMRIHEENQYTYCVFTYSTALLKLLFDSTNKPLVFLQLLVHMNSV